MSRKAPVGKAGARLMAEFDDDAGARLVGILKAASKGESRRFLPAARQAGAALELRTPTILAPTPHGTLAGRYTTMRSGSLTLVVASAARSILVAVPIARAPDIAASARAELALALDRPEIELPADICDALPEVVLRTLGKFGRNALKDGAPGRDITAVAAALILSRLPDFTALRGMAEAGVIPALVVLLAKDRQGTVCLPFVHGRPFPELALADAAGEA